MTKSTAVCAGCKKAIGRNFLKAMGKVWHVDHFKCDRCHTALSTQTFFEKNGKAYCKNDFLELFCHKCSKCKEYITKEVVCALGTHWHVNCFTCTTCNKPIQPPYFFEKEGKPYCNDDYAKNFAPICKGCEEYIFEDYLKVLGGQWHCSCFLCRDCKKPIKDKFFLIDKKQICVTCMNKGKNKKKPCYQSCCTLDQRQRNQ